MSNDLGPRIYYEEARKRSLWQWIKREPLIYDRVYLTEDEIKAEKRKHGIII